jgi:hypothetical protein
MPDHIHEQRDRQNRASAAQESERKANDSAGTNGEKIGRVHCASARLCNCLDYELSTPRGPTILIAGCLQK